MTTLSIHNQSFAMPEVSHHDTVIALSRVKDLIREIEQNLKEPQALRAIGHAQSNLSLAMLRLMEIEAEAVGFARENPVKVQETSI